MNTFTTWASDAHLAESQVVQSNNDAKQISLTLKVNSFIAFFGQLIIGKTPNLYSIRSNNYAKNHFFEKKTNFLKIIFLVSLLVISGMSLLLSSSASAQTLVKTCTPANVSGCNNVRGNDGPWFDFSISGSSASQPYSIQSASWKEYSNGTVVLTGRLVNVNDSNVQFDMNINLTKLSSGSVHYDYNANDPFVSSSYPTSNTNAGISVRFTLAQ